MPLYAKTVIDHSSLYIAAFTKSSQLPYILFIHGGPGLNSGILEELIQKEGIFDSLIFNIILYDQQGCGRSKKINNPVLHNDNINDLDEVYKILTDKATYNIAAIAGHSYGAKLIFDYLLYSKNTIPSIFIAAAPSMLTPRVNNLLLELTYLKTVNRKEYENILEEFTDYNSKMFWLLTERLAKVFQENNARPYFYWANLFWKDKVAEIQNIMSLPINLDVFKSVRQNLYAESENFSTDIDTTLQTPYLWINGFHDLIMDGASAYVKKSSSVKLFFKSAHYPHIEEHKKFCETVNAFLKI